MKRQGFLLIFSVFITSCEILYKSSYGDQGRYTYAVTDTLIRPTNNPDFPGLLRHADYLRMKRFWTEEVGRFYAARHFRPAWIRSGVPSDSAVQLYTGIGKALANGLIPEDYHYQQIGFMIRELMDAARQGSAQSLQQYANFDLLLTHSYLRYASDLLSGKVNPNNLEFIWEAHPRSKDLAGYLERALSGNRVEESLDELNPKILQYERIHSELNRYLDLQYRGDWSVPGALPVLHRNDTGRHVERVREFLVAKGDLSSVYENGEGSHLFDDNLEWAVQSFQYRHGLKVDGIIGGKTIVEMNRSIEWRIERLRTNMERLRWLPEDFGPNYLMINLPEYKLRYYENDAIAEEMKVIIGTVKDLTPILVDTLVYIEFNPTWTIPVSIATEEMLPGLIKDPDYLRKRNIYILDVSSRDRRVNPDSIDWVEVDKDEFPYIFVQKPGPWNALGKLKFIFPNRLAIYLHDTPADHLFQAEERTFSHGCVRMERPVDLAESLLEKFNNISRDSINSLMSDTIPRRVYIEGTVPVYFTYQTVWVDRIGNLVYRDDVYALDSALSELNDVYHFHGEIRSPFPLRGYTGTIGP